MEVLDKGFVNILDVYGSELTIVNAARVSFGKQVTELKDKDISLIKYLAEHKHQSPFRHTALRLHIKMPIFVMRQFVKHRIGVDINEISGRYVEFNADDFYVPLRFRYQSTDNKQGSSGDLEDGPNMRALIKYNDACKHSFAIYQDLIAHGIAKEMCRMVLPLSLYTEIHVTMSLEAIAHFVKLRVDSHAQYEIRQYANAIQELSMQHFPNALQALLEN